MRIVVIILVLAVYSLPLLGALAYLQGQPFLGLVPWLLFFSITTCLSRRHKKRQKPV